ncbi:MarR family transcriptional regulator [Nakamurella sp. YIM 132087]|uniref:MarR family transcriptional regulator n=1 Tax=Nakamurella alba TaxID=2665158 RepID=A0A7K1FUR3_9ACTN|nr:MarR family transcriptional regulator [Nakamurella alba]
MVPPSNDAPAVGAVDVDQVAALRTAVVILSRRMRYQTIGQEISPSEMAVLGRVKRDGPLTPGALARGEHVQPPSMTRLLERLEAQGLVRRDPDPDDRRQVLVSVTQAALEFIEQTKTVRAEWLSGQLAGLDEADRAAVLAAAGPLLRLAELP